MMEVEKPPCGAEGDQKPISTQQRLPSTLLGTVFDHLPYSEVRRALQTGKEISTTVAQNVQTLNIMAPNEMDAIAARRFPNVEQVNILCLFDCEHSGPRDRPKLTLKPQVVSRIVPFLISIPKLRQVSCGGFVFGRRGGGRGFREYRPDLEVEEKTSTENEEGVIEVMRAFAGAFATRALNPTLEVKGLGAFPWALDEYDRSMDAMREKGFQVFREVVATFPFSYVLRSIVSAQCHELFEVEPFLNVYRRDGSNTQIGGWNLRAWQFVTKLMNGMVRRGVDSAENEEERRDIEDICAKTQRSISLHYEDWFFMRAKDLDSMENFTQMYFPKPGDVLTHDDMYYFIFEIGDFDNTEILEMRSDNYCYLLSSTFDRLISIGAPLRRNDPRLVLLDDYRYPLLRTIGSRGAGRTPANRSPASMAMEEV